ncbi:MAG: RNA methyltransferase [Clostridiales bacterium]|nr:RNA methyltransferase [Clostridiales bacterium]
MDKFVFESGAEFPYILSRQNARVSAAASLSEKKFRETHGAFLCEGIKLTEEALKFGSVREVFVRESSSASMESIALFARGRGAQVTVLSDHAFDKISSEKSPQGIIAVAETRHFNDDPTAISSDKTVLLLDSVRDPGNLGTILRSACALGNVCTVLYSCADVYNPKTVRAAMGAIFKSDIFTATDIRGFLEKLKSGRLPEGQSGGQPEGRRIIAALPSGDSLVLGKYSPQRGDCLVIGNEGHGISDEVTEIATDTVMIPMGENTESLNAAVAASVILWEYFRAFQ